MTEVVRAADLQPTALLIVQVCELDELAQLLVQGRARVGPVPVTVHVLGDEQVPRHESGEAADGHLPIGPLLLRADDRDRVGVDQDRAGPSSTLVCW